MARCRIAICSNRLNTHCDGTPFPHVQLYQAVSPKEITSNRSSCDSVKPRGSTELNNVSELLCKPKSIFRDFSEETNFLSLHDISKMIIITLSERWLSTVAVFLYNMLVLHRPNLYRAHTHHMLLCGPFLPIITVHSITKSIQYKKKNPSLSRRKVTWSHCITLKRALQCSNPIFFWSEIN